MEHTKRHQPRRTPSRLLRLSMPSKPRLLRLVPLQPLGSTLIQLTLERILLFLLYNLVFLNMRSVAPSAASAQLMLLNNGTARAALQQLAAQETTCWGRGARHGCVIPPPVANWLIERRERD
jgi:hypothetical protein